MDIKKIETFLQVAEHKSYRLENYNKTAGSVRKQIKSLERELSVSLVTISKKNVFLTNHGETFAHFLPKIVNDYNVTLTKIRDNNSNIGVTRIVTSHTTAGYWMPKILKTLVRKYPDLRYEIVGTDNNYSSLKSPYDVIISPKLSGENNLIKKLVKTFNYKLFASTEYINRNGMPQSIEDLQNHVFIAEGSSVENKNNAFSGRLKKLAVTNRANIVTNSSLGLYNMVIEGIGIGAISEESASKNETLKNVLPFLEPDVLELYFQYPKHLDSFNKIQLLYNHIITGEY